MNGYSIQIYHLVLWFLKLFNILIMVLIKSATIHIYSSDSLNSLVVVVTHMLVLLIHNFIPTLYNVFRYVPWLFWKFSSRSLFWLSLILIDIRVTKKWILLETNCRHFLFWSANPVFQWKLRQVQKIPLKKNYNNHLKIR